MKYKSLIIAALCFFSISSVSWGDDGSSQGISENEIGPVAFLPADKTVFSPVLEGEYVIHDFIVENRGAAPLRIEKVKTGCGCVVASYTKTEIPRGGEGSIRVRINTNGYGGRKMIKRVSVFTNDKSRPKLTLNLSGMVEKFAFVTPKSVHLRGVAGEQITSTVTIVPADKYPFLITGAKTGRGVNIKINLEEMKHENGRKYLLTVDNLKEQKGRYVDTVSLKTDNDIRPEILIRVYGNIRENKSKRIREKS